MERSIYTTEGGCGGLSADALGNFRVPAVVAASRNNYTTKGETKAPSAGENGAESQKYKEANVNDEE